MPILHKRRYLLLLACPLAAMADPVTVTTRSTGTSTVDSVVLSTLGLEPVATTELLPYALTLSSTFDPDTMPPSSEFWAWNDASEVVIDYRIGHQVYHYEGIASSTAHLYGQSANVEEYGHGVGFLAPSLNIGFYHLLYGPTGSMGQTAPLGPLKADDSDGVYAYASVTVDPTAPEVGSFSMGGWSSTVSVRVIPVPEPASFALLAAGLATLGLGRRLRPVPRLAAGAS